MADLVELVAEGVDRLVDSHHFDKGYDKGYDVYRKYVNGKEVESTVTPYDRDRDGKRRESNAGAQSNAQDTSEKRSPPRASQSQVGGNSREVRSSAAPGGAPSGGPESHHPSITGTAAAQSSSRRKHRNDLPSPERDNFALTALPAAAVGAAAAGAYTYNNTAPRNGEFERQSSLSDQVLREYEREADDPTRRAEKVLSPSQLNKIPRSSTVKSKSKDYRRDSAMTSRYADDYREAGSQYAGSNRPRSQPARSRYDDDGDSDYDEKSGRRSRNTGRGYDDREYDRVVEETERYRGPVGAGPLVPFARRDEEERAYSQGPGNTTVTRYREGDRDGNSTYLTRRSSRRGRDSEYSSRSRSRSRSGGPRWKEKLEDTFDTSAQGLGVGLAGAVIGGLAGREFGGKNGGKNAQRDMAIGAIIGGLGANIAENKYREWREKKEDEKFDRREERWEGRSRSNVR